VTRVFNRTAAAIAISFGIQGLAHADTASTTGGIKIKSDDGNFDASIGGRIHFDGTVLAPDSGAFNGGKDNRGSAGLNNASGFYFRRIFLSLNGHAYGWEYKVDDDLVGGQAGAAPTITTTTTTTTVVPTSGTLPSNCKAGTGSAAGTATCTGTSTSTSTPSASPVTGFQDVYLGHSVFTKNDEVYLGQRKPWRAFEEIQSNNEILFMERPVTSASGIFGGRDYQDGVFYRINDKSTGLWFGVSGYSLSKIGQNSTEGTGVNTRIAWAPINTQGGLLHLGFSYSSDNADNNNALTPKYTFGGYKLSTTDALTLANYAGSSGGNATQNTWTGELAGIWGPAYLEGEYAHADIGAKSAAQSSGIDAYYVQASFFLTGESKSYNATTGVVSGNPKPLHSYGAVEFKARYEDMDNRSVGDIAGHSSSAAAIGCTATNAPKQSSKSPYVIWDKCAVSDVAVGINYYVNPNVRFMFDYIAATADLGQAGKDKPQTYAARAQISF
jgi:phosphate-selective porin OprO/OprP